MQSNIILPYEHESTDSDSDDSQENLTNNLSVLYKHSPLQDVKLLDDTNALHYNSLRDKYFTPELIKKRILIDTHKLTDRNTSNYTIFFKNNDNHTTGGFSNFNNVIGFKLRKAISSFEDGIESPCYSPLLMESHAEILIRLTQIF